MVVASGVRFAVACAAALLVGALSLPLWRPWADAANGARTLIDGSAQHLAGEGGASSAVGACGLLIGPMQRVGILSLSSLCAGAAWIAAGALMQRFGVASSDAQASVSIEWSSAPVVCLSATGEVVGWSKQLEALTSILESDALGRPLVDLVLQESRGDLRLALAAEAPRARSVELAFGTGISRSGGPAGAGVTMTFFARAGADGCGGELVGLAQDMDAVVASRAMRERRRTLREITTTELESPLEGIVGMSTMLAEFEGDVQRKRCMCLIAQTAGRLLHSVYNILHLTDGDSSEDVCSEERAANMLDIIDEVVVMTRAAMDRGGRPLLGDDVRLIEDSGLDSLPLVRCEPSLCSQLVYALVTNACKSTDNGFVTVAARKLMDFVEVEVSDNGDGIQPQDVQNAFEPFRQEPSKGLGLGLAAAYRIACQLGGSIRVNYDPGVGTTFTVKLPSKEEEAGRTWAKSGPVADSPRGTSSDSLAFRSSRWRKRTSTLDRPMGIPCLVSSEDGSAAAAPAAAIPSHGDLTLSTVPTLPSLLTLPALPSMSDEKPLVLVVDDDQAHHMIVQSRFSKCYRIVSVTSGPEGLEYLRSNNEQPSIVLLDYMMPRMTGLEVVKEIRTGLGMGHLVLPVIILSTLCPQTDVATDCVQHGATDFVAKPFTTRVLAHKMKVLLNAREAYMMALNRIETPRTQVSDQAAALALECEDGHEEEKEQEDADSSASRSVAMAAERPTRLAAASRDNVVSSEGASWGDEVQMLKDALASLDAEVKAAVERVGKAEALATDSRRGEACGCLL